MNIVGMLLHLKPDLRAAAANEVAARPGVEIHAQQEDGRMVITIDDDDTYRLTETMMTLHTLPGVLAASLIYHHSEDEAATVAGGQAEGACQ
jgi:periplasmic nitrate reductase NapD